MLKKILEKLRGQKKPTYTAEFRRDAAGKIERDDTGRFVRDGDGDGKINDGKPTEAPAPAKKPAAKKAPAKKAPAAKKSPAPKKK